MAAAEGPAVSSNFVPSPDPPTDSKVHPAEKFAKGVLHSGASVSKIDVLRIFDLLPDTDMLRGDRTRARDSGFQMFHHGCIHLQQHGRASEDYV